MSIRERRHSVELAVSSFVGAFNGGVFEANTFGNPIRAGILAYKELEQSPLGNQIRNKVEKVKGRLKSPPKT